MTVVVREALKGDMLPYDRSIADGQGDYLERVDSLRTGTVWVDVTIAIRWVVVIKAVAHMDDAVFLASNFSLNRGGKKNAILPDDWRRMPFPFDRSFPE